MYTTNDDPGIFWNQKRTTDLPELELEPWLWVVMWKMETKPRLSASQAMSLALILHVIFNIQ